MALQRTIGNAAVQRLLQRKDDPAQKASLPVAFATLTLARGGEVEGTSRAPGHEGKVEILALVNDTERTQSGAREREKDAPVNLQVVLALGPSAQVLMRAANEADMLESAKFEFVKHEKDGKLSVAQTLEFENGTITGIHVSGGDTPMLTLSLEFQPRS